MMGRKFSILLALFLVLGMSGAAHAEDGVLGEIDAFLKGASDTLDDNLIFGKFRFTPKITQKIIYDDNIWQNDQHEGERVADAQGNAQRETRGRTWDFISDSTIDLSLELPLNPKYTKFFKKDKIVLLGYRVSFIEFMRRGETDSINQTVYTDIFGFLSDLFSINLGKEQGLFIDASASWRDVTNPIDIFERELGKALVGIPDLPPIIRQDSEFRWHEFMGTINLGYRGNRWDVKGGYQFDWIDFSKDFYSQADQKAHTGRLEVGASPLALGDARVFLRAEYTDLEFTEGLLNDANIWDIRLGFEGAIPSLFSSKMRFLLEAGILDWDTQQTGSFSFRKTPTNPIQVRENPDRDDFNGFVYMAQIVYQPWEDKQTRFQFEAGRDLVWSAIANFRSDYYVELSAYHELIPRKLNVDAIVSWSRYDPSQGPHRRMFEVGAGITYNLLEQVTLSARYLYRIQKGRKELELTFVDPNNPGAPVLLTSDSDFFQNVFSVAIEVKF